MKKRTPVRRSLGEGRKKKMNPFRFLKSEYFWVPFGITLSAAGLFFAWELGVFINLLPSFPRPSVLPSEFAFTATLSFLLAFDIGLAVWQRRFGSCPRGIKRASSVATALGALTLVCPACTLLPASFIGVSTMLSLMAMHMPAVRIVSIGLLLITALMLWPKRE